MLLLQWRHHRLDALGFPVAALQPEGTVAEGIHQVLAALGEADCFFHQGLGAVVETNLTGFHQGGDGMGAGFLAAASGDRQHPRHAAPEGLQHSWTIGSVLDQHGVGPQALLLQRLQAAQQEPNHLWQAKAVPRRPKHFHLQGSYLGRPLVFACARVQGSGRWCE